MTRDDIDLPTHSHLLCDSPLPPLIARAFSPFFFRARIVRNRGSLSDNGKLGSHHTNSSPTTSTETSTTTTNTAATTPNVGNGATSAEEDSRSHAAGVSSSPNGYSIHSLLNHSQYNLHSNEYSTKRSHHHHHHGSRPSHPVGKRPLVKLSTENELDKDQTTELPEEREHSLLSFSPSRDARSEAFLRRAN